MKRTLLSLAAICLAATPAFCGTVTGGDVPEPGTIGLIATGLASVGAFAFFKGKKK